MKKLLLTLTVILAFTVTTFAQSIPEGEYVIKFANNPNYVLTLKDGKANNSNPIHLWQWQNNNSQRWKVTYKDGKIVIRSMVDNNYVLDVKGYNYNNGAEVYIYGYHGGNNQLWIPEKQSNGSYVLMTAGNQNFCLDLYNGSATNGNKIELWNAHKGWQEQWIFEKASNMPAPTQLIPEGEYVIKFANNPNYVLTLKDGKANNSNPIHLWQWQNNNSQRWKVTHKDGRIVIRSMVDNNYVLDVKGYNYNKGAEVYIYGYHGGNNQLWIPEKQGNGSYVLMTAGNQAFCLDLYNGSATNGNKIELWDAHKGWQEQWIFEKASNMPSGYQLNSKNVPDGKYIIRCANNPDYVVTMKDGCFSDNSVIHISKWRGLDWQKWIVTHKDGKIVFRSVLEPARVINVYVQNGIGNGQYIALYWGDDPAINQLWIPELQSNGTYVLMYGNNKAYSLDLRNGEAIEDGKIQLYETHKGAAQQWILEKIE